MQVYPNPCSRATRLVWANNPCIQKVGELETMADFESALVILSKVGG